MMDRVRRQAHPLQHSGLVEVTRQSSTKLPMTSFVPTVRKGPGALPRLRRALLVALKLERLQRAQSNQRSSRLQPSFADGLAVLRGAGAAHSVLAGPDPSSDDPHRGRFWDWPLI